MTPNGGSGLRKTSSLVISSPTKSNVPGRRPGKIAVDVVPDSEEERRKETTVFKGEIVEVSSDSELDDDRRNKSSNIKRIPSGASDPFLSSPENPGATPSKFNALIVKESDTESDSDMQPRYRPKTTKMWLTVVSDSEDELGNNEEYPGITEPAEATDDGAVLVLNDPPSSRSPAARNPNTLRKRKEKKEAPSDEPAGGNPTKGQDPSLVQTPSHPQSNTAPGAQTKLPDFFTPKCRPKKTKGGAEETCPTKDSSTLSAVIATPTTKNAKPKRKTKKVLQQEKQAHLAAYAQALFDELNASVFMHRLPKDTPLIWNNRLLATAGRAKWHKDSKGVVTTCIELATKVLDCEERIRNTLSHEMCHLACWVINCNPNENHGGVWRGWVEEVMLKRPDICITKKHSYDISYKYEWQCQTPTCKKIYGRFSKSIDPAESICGACKVGELLPLFQVRTRKVKAISKLAATTTRDSPVTGTPRPPGAFPFTPTRQKNKPDDGVILIVSSSDSDRGSISGAETEIETIAKVSEPKPTVFTTKIPQTDAGKDDLQKLVTHMSYIDLTSD